MESNTVPSQYLYLDSQTKVSKGPLSEMVILKLVEKGIAVQADTLIWKPGMAEWEPLSKISPFKEAVEILNRPWFYITNGVQKGPVISRFILHKFGEGQIDGETLVYSDCLSNWTKLSDVTILQGYLRQIAEEEAARVKIQDPLASIDASSMVFSSENDDNEDSETKARAAAFKEYEKFKAKQAAEAAEQNKEEKKQILQGDDGKWYSYNGETNEWEEDSDIEEEMKALESQDVDNREDNEPESEDEVQEPKEKSEKQKRKRKKAKKSPNHWIYITGLPPDISYEEVKIHFSNVGLIDINPVDQMPKIKIYRNEFGQCKGDASLCYHAPESVELALQILDGGYIRPDYQIAVSLATFPSQGKSKSSTNDDNNNNSNNKNNNSNNKNNGNEDDFPGEKLSEGSQSHHQASSFAIPSLPSSIGEKRKMTFPSPSSSATAVTASTSTSATASTTASASASNTVTAMQRKVARQSIQQALSWNEEDDIGIVKAKALRIVVLEGMFAPSDFHPLHPSPNMDVSQYKESKIRELEEDIGVECSKCGEIEKITLFSKHPKGIVIVKFKTAFAAQACIKCMEGRFFAGRKIRCFFWDGVTNYSLAQDVEQIRLEEQEEQERLEEFGDWLDHDQEDLPPELRLRVE